MTLFPTEQWFERYGRRLDTNERLDELAAGWGVNSDGDIRFVLEDIPLAETTLGDLPEEVLADLPEGIRASVEDVTLADAPGQFDETIRPSLPEQVQDLLRQIEENVVDGEIHAHLRLREGSVTDVTVLSDPDSRSASVVVRGPLTTWQQIVDGRPTLSALLTEGLVVETDAVRLARYSTMLQFLGDVAAEVETTHLFETQEQSVADGVVDVATGSSAAVQKSAERQARRVLRDFPLL